MSTKDTAAGAPAGAITVQALDAAAKKFAAERANVIAKNAVTSKGLSAVAKNPEAAAKNTTVFDIEVKQGERTDQKRSGRCWMFASLNTMRARVIKKYDLKNFEFSQAYPLFWDKLEKSNWFFENILSTLDEPTDGRMIAFLLFDPIGDGGQWDMFRALVEKYGLVPKEAMPECANSENTASMDKFLTRYLRGCAAKLRHAHEDGVTDEALHAMKDEFMGNVYNYLVICLGMPPKSFDVRLRDKDDKLVLSGTFTPQAFREEVLDMNLQDYVSLISAPTKDKPYLHTYTVDKLGNVVEAGGVRYLNLPPEELKRAAIAQLKDDLPVWFGCDVDQSYLQNDGIMDLDALDIDPLVGFDIIGGFDKADRLDYAESVMTHAMVLEGVNLDEKGAPTLWKVENSWGKDHAKDGFDSLTDDWFGEYVYQVVVDKKYLTDEQRRVFETETPTVLAPWDPFGALA
ncbi:MAG: C1 family peptidase [Coriobacteriaceae bacterium]|nr:C1 family peptidase [Coriobacteriaceae bacterium]